MPSQAEATRLHVLARASDAFAEDTTDLAKLAATVVRLLVEEIGDSAALRIVDDAGYLRMMANDGRDKALAREGRALSEEVPQRADEGIAVKAFERGEPLLIAHVTPEMLYASTKPEYAKFMAERLGVHSMIVAPLIARGQRLGVLYLTRYTGGPTFTQDDAELVQDLAQRAALAMDNARLYSDLEKRVHERTAELETALGQLSAANTELEAAMEEVAASNQQLEDAVVELEASNSELAIANEKLRELEILKNNFMASVTHEFRTPLTSIQGFAEFLADELAGPLTDDQRGFVTQIERAVRRLEYLVNDLLDMAALDAGTFKLRCETVDLGWRVEDAVGGLLPQAEEAGVTLETALFPEPVECQADAQRLGQIVTNLVANAIRFTPRGGTVTVRARRERGCARIEVCDTGEGIRPEELPRLFQRFSQLESGVRHGKGTGLGLSICKALVEAHGGEIGVDSEPGQGCRFWFWIPAGSPEA